MIIRVYLLFGIVLLGVTGYFIVVQQPPTVQSVPGIGEVTRLQEEGILPEGDPAEDEEVEHSVFEVPEMDEVMLEAAMANMDMGGMDMGGMDMGGMDMDGDMNMAEGEQVLDMDMDGDGVMDMSSADMANDGGMDMSMDGDGDMNMAEGEQVLDVDMDGDGVMDMSSADMANDGGMDMNMDGDMDMGGNGEMAMADSAGQEEAEHGEEEAEGDGDPHGEDEEAEAVRMAQQMAGLMILEDGEFDREIELSMTEWSFSNLEIDAQPGERIRFKIRNDGVVLHEFMFMSMAAMQAVNYRAKRADWSLLEHEALYEKSLLLPGQELVFVAEVIRPGAWMFMCMLPYHMQMGMMGQMATPGMAMEM